MNNDNTEPLSIPNLEIKPIVDQVQQETIVDQVQQETIVDQVQQETIVDQVQPSPLPVEEYNEDYEPSDDVKEFVDKIYSEYKELVTTLNIAEENFILVVAKCLERVNKIKKLSDQDKYDVAILIINRLVDEVPGTDASDRYYLRNMVPSLVNIVLDASKGKLKLNVKRKQRKNIDIKKIIDDLYNQVIEIIKENHYTAKYLCSNIVIIVGMLMSAVEQYPDLSGMEKKAIVVKIFDRLIDELVMLFNDMDDTLKNLVQHAKLMLPSIIDMLVSVGKNHFKILTKKCNSLFGCCKN
jgi:hypothetical protein